MSNLTQQHVDLMLDVVSGLYQDGFEMSLQAQSEVEGNKFMQEFDAFTKSFDAMENALSNMGKELERNQLAASNPHLSDFDAETITF